ncbi:MAG: NUDIX domain-containing protein [Ruminococcus sp.]|nr:NUDIX domain-containing protein [Ruminococcus sp.]
MELFDVYDRFRQPLGRTIPRGEAFSADEFRIVIHVAIFNDSGQMLIQRRVDGKQGWGGMWDVSAGGSIQSGESSGVGATREVAEEIGIDFNFSDKLPQLTVTTQSVFDDYYIIRLTPDISTLKLQETEVAEIKWADFNEIAEKIRSGIFIPYHESFIKTLFDIDSNTNSKSVVRFADE